MAAREHIYETHFSGFNPDNVNPDRVGFDETAFGRYERVHTRSRTVHVQRGPSFRPLNWGEIKARFRRLALPFLVATAALNVGANVGTERRTSAHAGHEFIQPDSAGDFLARINKAAGEIVDVDVIHRFMTRDAEGHNSFNAGGLIAPLAVGVTTERDMNINLEVAAGQTWAPDFETTGLNNPERVQELRDMIVAELLRKYPQHISIRGIEGATNTTGAWNAQGREFAVAADGSLAPQALAGLALENIGITGGASDEAGSASGLGARDVENESLALIRANNLLPTVLEALRGAHIDPSQVESIELQGVENILTPADIERLADIAYRQSQWDREGGTTEEWAQRTVEAYNRQPGSLTLVEGDAEILQRTLDQMRNARLVINARGAEQSFHSLNIVIPLPLLLLLLGFKGAPGGTRRKDVPYEVLITTDYIRRDAVKRRLFAETNPADYGGSLGAQRDFHAVYDSIDLHAHAADLPRMQQHMLTEEVLPSLRRGTQEPYIDYMSIANGALEFMYSDTPKFGIRKGRYPTSDEAQRFVTEELIKMWEHHDQAVFPMEERGSEIGGLELTGTALDLKQQLNYRHSKEVVLWAKLLAEQFTLISEQLYAAKNEALAESVRPDALPILTRDEFESLLRERIAANAETARGDDNRRKNAFVVSAQPDGADYGSRMY